MVSEFCGHAFYEKRKRMCFRGTSVDGTIVARDDVVTEPDQNLLFVIHQNRRRKGQSFRRINGEV